MLLFIKDNVCENIIKVKMLKVHFLFLCVGYCQIQIESQYLETKGIFELFMIKNLHQPRFPHPLHKHKKYLCFAVFNSNHVLSSFYDSEHHHCTACVDLKLSQNLVKKNLYDEFRPHKNDIFIVIY